jgi:hypothetical protein
MPLICSSEEVGHYQKVIVFFKITKFTKLISMEKTTSQMDHMNFLSIKILLNKIEKI